MKMSNYYRLKLLMLLLVVASCQQQESVVERTIPEATFTEENGHYKTISGTFNVSGIYPHLTTYTHSRTDQKQSYVPHHRKKNKMEEQWECGIGALAEWQGKLYMINYAAHQPEGSEHSLYIVDEELNMEIFEGSVGGTPASRMIHQESNQLFIGHYAIDSVGNIRVIDIKKMPGRLTAIARHLKDPEHKIYYYDMEGMLYEVDVHSLEPTLIGDDPLPGWHGKGGYTAQGKLVLANNGGGRDKVEKWQVDSTGMLGPEMFGVLAEYDGEKFKVVERKQFTDVTTKHGIKAIPNDNSPLWSMGWDKRSVRLKVMENGEWSTFLLPKAAYNNDPGHGWFTEWPRIREVHDGKFMMDMHGMFYDFPSTFSKDNNAGIRPIGSHLRYIPDFLYWNNKIVLATDEVSIQGNPIAGQPQSNLWFGDFEELSQWGPKSAYGSIWLGDEVKANEPSLPYLFAGFDNRTLHLINHADKEVNLTFEIDKAGNGAWTEWKRLTIPASGYIYELVETGINAEWIRATSDSDAKLTVSLHFTDDKLQTSNGGLFEGVASSTFTGEVSHSKLYQNHDNFNLTVFKGDVQGDSFKETAAYELDKFDFSFTEGLKDSSALKTLSTEPVPWKHYKLESIIYEEDEASVIIKSEKHRLRLPKGKGNYAKKALRNVRELQSERSLANIHGTFYELPLSIVGEEPEYLMMRPVSTHNRMISDFATWNGLLLLNGIQKDAPSSERIIKDASGELALWIGGIDDLWKFGKPVGEGGVWKNTAVKAGERSDKFLMTGYDKKTVQFSADQDVEITLYIDVAHYLDQTVPYKTFSLKAGETMEHTFPEGFSAHWIAAEADKDCTATVWFIYE